MPHLHRALACLSLTFALAACNDHPISPFQENLQAEIQDEAFLEGRGKVDILWVIDNSGSMCEEQEDLKENFNSFVQILQETKFDFHLAVITTDTTNPAQAGRFQNIPNAALGPSCDLAIDVSACPAPQNGRSYPPLILRSEDYMLPNGELDADTLRLHFACNASVGTRGTGFEAGLEAARLALGPNLRQGYNSGFLRDDAHLAVFFLSDENDCSWLPGQASGRNGNDCEWYPEHLTPIQDYVDFFTQLKGDPSRVILGGILAPDTGARFAPGQQVTPSCVSETGSGSGYAGYRYQQLIEAFRNGATANVCQPPFGAALEGLAALLPHSEILCLSQPLPTCTSDAQCQGEARCEARSDSPQRFCSDLRIVIERTSSEPLEGRACQRAADDQHRCELQEDQDFTIDYGDTLCPSGVSLQFNEDLRDASHVAFRVRYPRDLSSPTPRSSGLTR